MGAALVGCVGLARDQALALEGAQHAAEIATVEVQFFADLRGGNFRRLPQFIKNARFGQGKSGLQQVPVKHADFPRVETVEAADGSGGIWHGPEIYPIS